MQKYHKTLTEEKNMERQRHYSHLVLDAVCSYLQSEQMINDTEMRLFRRQWIAKERE